MKEFLHDVTKHMAHWASLVGLVAFAMLGFLMFPYDVVFRLAVIVSFGISFVVWGVVHHFLHNDLHPKVVLEYAMTALLGVIFVLFLLWRA